MNELSNIIALLTDFGLRDPYVALMKAVIYRINPSARVIDLAHELPSFSIDIAAYMLLVSYRYFPRNTIFVVVVDPGVGSSRRAIIVKSRNYIFVGPDNGVLYPAIIDDGVVEIINITNEKFFLKPVSNTFHGRDIFAPVAAYISLGVDYRVLGEKLSLDEIVEYELKLQSFKPSICGEVIYIDKFGNVVLNISYPDFNLSEHFSYAEIRVNNKRFNVKVGRSFSDVEEGDLVLYVNSFGLLEIGVNTGNAAKVLGVRLGDDVCLKLST